MSDDRKLWLDTRGVPVVTTSPNGERNAQRWGWTPAVAVPVDKALDPEHHVSGLTVGPSADALTRERDFSGVDWKTMFEREVNSRRAVVARLRRERDAAVARADQLRDERDEALSAGLEALGVAESKVRVLEGERAAQPAPAVTRDEIEKVVEAVFDREAGYDHGSDRPWPGTEPVASAVWDNLKGTDPAVHVVRESDVEAQAALRNRFSEFVVNGTVLNVMTAEDCREKAQRHLDAAARCESIARAIEDEQAADPVEEQTDALADILYGHEMVTDQMRGVLERVVRAGMLFPEQEATGDE